MIFFVFSVGLYLAKWMLITVVVLVFIEIGPGGNVIGSFVMGLKNTLVIIDFSVLYEASVHDLNVLFGNISI